MCAGYPSLVWYGNSTTARCQTSTSWCLPTANRQTTVLEEITIDKLICISRAENARRNSAAAHSTEYGKLAQLKGAITRQVNRIIKEHEQRQSP